MDYKDYYKILGVQKTATEKEIRTSYRKLARELHPDVNPNNKDAEKRFKDVNEAYDVLSDKEKRKKYDQLGANWKQYESWQRAGSGRAGGPAADFGDLFSGGRTRTSAGGGPGGYRRVTPEELEDLFGSGPSDKAGGGSPFSDFFETFFGGGGSKRTTTRGGSARQGQNVDQPIDVTLEESLSGTTRVIQVTDDQSGKTKRLEVKIPPGVVEGSRVRVAGQGAPGVLGGPAGDLYLVVRMTPSALFTRDGDDLRVRVPVKMTTAVLGGEIEVPTPKGTKLALKIPSETQDGRVFRLRGQGMPKLGSTTERGDLFAEVHVQVPEGLTPRQRELFEQLAELETGAAATT